MNLAIGDSFGDDVLEVVMQVIMVVDVDDKVNVNKAMNEESDVVDVLLEVVLRFCVESLLIIIEVVFRGLSS